MGGVIKMLLILLGTSSFWAMLTSERDEQRWRYANVCALVCAISLCIWHTLK
jgi:hypothetical protein